MAQLDGIAPLRDQLAAVITARIESGEYPPGSKLPTAQQLADEFEISARTVTDALAILRERGLLIGVRGRGVFVSPDIRPADTPQPDNG
ncbi:winged helix-turn-helix domain-containing protein [Thermomonospora catenispora]|uniref:winged helix-turn-helix domain-containing protein n=1 Tax=Thermomonospora catenispora TaxID=2493090 RepID=UPI0011227F74|nr:winged helix-turn-helix domain-containing protein [Thermomonospora catenispora]TNY38697.1 GntR family transcriptional regulator [Thermomonospora catenispora]